MLTAGTWRRSIQPKPRWHGGFSRARQRYIHTGTSSDHPSVWGPGGAGCVSLFFSFLEHFHFFRPLLPLGGGGGGGFHSTRTSFSPTLPHLGMSNDGDAVEPPNDNLPITEPSVSISIGERGIRVITRGLILFVCRRHPIDNPHHTPRTHYTYTLLLVGRYVCVCMVREDLPNRTQNGSTAIAIAGQPLGEANPGGQNARQESQAQAQAQARAPKPARKARTHGGGGVSSDAMLRQGPSG